MSGRLNILVTLPDLHVGGAASLLLQSLSALQKVHNFHLVYFGTNEALLEKFRNSGVPVTRVVYRRPTDFFSAARTLRKLLRVHKIDVVHCNLIFDKALICLSTVGTGVKRVATLHSAGRQTGKQLVKHRVKSGVEVWLHKHFFHRSIAVSNASLKYWTDDKGLDAEKISVVYNGIARLQRSSVVPANVSSFVKKFPIVLGTACRFHYIKGIPRLLRAFSIVRETHPSIGLLLIGDGGHRNEIEKTIRQHHLENCVFITGFSDDVASYLSHIHYYVNSSFTEAMPVSIIEALSLGIPVIASNVGGVPEIIFDDVNGYLVNFENAQDAASIINRAVSSHMDNYDRLAKAADRVYAEKFSSENYAQSLSKVYAQVVAGT
jgi:glycosyltransferase involved in cell wall biosynthesis